MDGWKQTVLGQDPENTIPGHIGHPEDRGATQSTHYVPRTVTPFSSHFVFPGALPDHVISPVLKVWKLREKQHSHWAFILRALRVP